MRWSLELHFTIMFVNIFHLFFILRHSLHHRLCDGGTWEVRSEIPRGFKVWFHVSELFNFFSWYVLYQDLRWLIVSVAFGFDLLVNFVTCSWHLQRVPFAIWLPKTGSVLFKISFCYRNFDDGCLCLNRIAKDPRFERLPCIHKGTYADDCIVERVTKVHFDYNFLFYYQCWLLFSQNVIHLEGFFQLVRGVSCH